MSEVKVYPVPLDVAARAHSSDDQYKEMYTRSIEDPEEFWAEQAEDFISWYKPWDKVTSGNFNDANIRWFEGARLNVSYNCLDRHLEKRGDQTAIIWEGDDPDVDKHISYRELHAEVCKFANVLKSRGVAKGDRVSIYMPMIPEAAVAMLACTRIGAVHSVVFGGFSPEALKDRILDSDCRVVITADEGPRGGKAVALKGNVDTALEQCPNVHTAVVVKRTAGEIPGTKGVMSGITRKWQRQRQIVRQKKWKPKTPSLFSTPPDQPVNPKVYCIQRPVISFLAP